MKRWRELSQRHRATIAAVAAIYLVVIVAVVTTSPLVRLDWAIRGLTMRQRWPELQPLVGVWVMLGQRAPAVTLATIWLTYRAWRTRSLRPLVVLVLATVLLNLSVGGVKVMLGRLGATAPLPFGSNGLFDGGTLFPSGHTSNAVVTWGVLAYVAVDHRRLKAALATIAAFTIGLAALYEGWHWFSDILAGWAAGGLVLLALPGFEPALARTEAFVRDLPARWRDHRRTPDDVAEGTPEGEPELALHRFRVARDERLLGSREHVADLYAEPDITRRPTAVSNVGQQLLHRGAERLHG